MLKLVRFLFVFLISASVYAAGVGFSGSGVGGVPSSPVFSGTVSSTKPCATGYTRKLPNYCRVNTPSAVVLTRDVCTSIGTVPSDARGVHLLALVRAVSANAVLARNTTLAFYTDSGCTVPVSGFPGNSPSANAYEATAVAAGANLSRQDASISLFPTGTGTAMWVLMSDDAGNQGLATTYVVGYYD